MPASQVMTLADMVSLVPDGASVALVPGFRAEAIEGQIAEYRATYLTGVPTMYARVLPHLRDLETLG